MSDDQWRLLSDAWQRGYITLGQAELLEKKFSNGGGTA